MEIVVERCAGLDVHKDSVVACVRFPAPLVLTRLHAHPIVDISPRKGVPVGSPIAVSRGVPA